MVVVVEECGSFAGRRQLGSACCGLAKSNAPPEPRAHQLPLFAERGTHYAHQLSVIFVCKVVLCGVGRKLETQISDHFFSLLHAAGCSALQ